MTGEDLVAWAFPGFVTGCIAVIAWFLKRLIEKMDGLETSSSHCAVEQATIKGEIKGEVTILRAHLAEHYATKLDANQLRSEALAIRAETHNSLERIHERIDQLPKEIISLVRKGSIE